MKYDKKQWEEKTTRMVGDTSFQKLYGLYGLKHHLVEISGDVTDAGRTEEQTTREESATQILICEWIWIFINVA